MKIIHNPDTFETLSQQYGVFSVFPEEVRSAMELRLYSKQEYIFLQGYLMEGFFYQLQGKVKLFHTLKNGRDSVLRFLDGPRIYGGCEFFFDAPASATAEVLEDTYCIYLPFHQSYECLRKNVDFLFYLGKNYAEIMYVSNNNFSINQFSALESRVAAYILSVSEGEIFSGSLRDVPGYLGISYRHLLRILNNFVQRGFLAKEEKHYRILNLPAMKAIAEDIYLT